MVFEAAVFDATLGDDIGLLLAASSTNTLTAQARILRSDGSIDNPRRDFAHADGNRDTEITSFAVGSGTLLGLNITVTGATKRGEVFIGAYLRRGDVLQQRLARGYVYAGGDVDLGDNIEALSGRGFLRWFQVFHDRAGNAAALDQSLAATNALRKIYGVAWYYHASGDVVTRTVVAPQVLNPAPTKPTGWTTTGSTGLIANLFDANASLTADEEGLFYINSVEGQDGYQAVIDNGTVDRADSSNNANPFPFWIHEDDLAIFRFPAITNGNANDRHSAYILMEEWINI